MADDLKSAFKALNEAVNDLPTKTLEEVGQFAVVVITARTRKGLDADRKKFKPYSARYARTRQRKSLLTTPVDLTVTGHMLGSMIPLVVGDNEVTVEFNSPKEATKAIGNTTHGRDFLDVRADAELDAIAELFGDKLLTEIVKK